MQRNLAGHRRAKKEGVEIISLEQAKNSISLNSLKSAKKSAALILGEEVKGLPDSILDRSDKIVHIPMYGKKNRSMFRWLLASRFTNWRKFYILKSKLVLILFCFFNNFI